MRKLCAAQMGRVCLQVDLIDIIVGVQFEGLDAARVLQLQQRCETVKTRLGGEVLELLIPKANPKP